PRPASFHSRRRDEGCAIGTHPFRRIRIDPAGCLFPETEITPVNPRNRFYILRNPIQPYAWGSRTAIAETLGWPAPSDKPQAEMWMGAHPKAASEVHLDGTWINLRDLIASDPVSVLGPRVARQFGGNFPFLFKLIAAERPLSIQAHPNREQARSGYTRENALGIPLDSDRRNYRDENHKPEAICALRTFWILYGFRSATQIISRVRALNLTKLEPEIRELAGDPSGRGLRNFFLALLNMSPARRSEVMGETVAAARRCCPSDPVCTWMTRLYELYPDDAGVLAPLFLNLVRLEPGRVLLIRTGQLHSYLEGVGLEVMANSDNVLRGGLTPKHVDVEELIRIVDFAPICVRTYTSRPRAKDEHVYPTHAREFRLIRIQLEEGKTAASSQRDSVEILFCIQGQASLSDSKGLDRVDLRKGASVLIPASTGNYRVEGSATIYKVIVP
ncbi:MAG: mannose-6-phosphate isomerase, class I, partial [Kiritimatiellia bacterium]